MDSVATFVQHYQGLLVGILGSGIAVWVWKRVLNPLRELMESQLRPNGGGSLTDKVDRIAPNHVAAETHWKALEENQENVKRDLSTARQELRGAIDALGGKFDDRVNDIQAELDRNKAFAQAAIRRLPGEQREALEELYRNTGPHPKGEHL